LRVPTGVLRAFCCLVSTPACAAFCAILALLRLATSVGDNCCCERVRPFGGVVSVGEGEETEASEPSAALFD
jgi:hypothetical protein